MEKGSLKLVVVHLRGRAFSKTKNKKLCTHHTAAVLLLLLLPPLFSPSPFTPELPCKLPEAPELCNSELPLLPPTNAETAAADDDDTCRVPGRSITRLVGLLRSSSIMWKYEASDLKPM